MHSAAIDNYIKVALTLFVMLLMIVVSVRAAEAECPSQAAVSPCTCHVCPSDGDQDLWLYCDNDQLDDVDASRILSAFISTSSKFVSPLREIFFFNNNLTRVPDEVRLFNNLDSITLGNNPIQSIESGPFNLTRKLNYLAMGNSVNNIRPGAFRNINFGAGSKLYLNGNQLSRFEASTFLSVLEKMKPAFDNDNTTGIYLASNPFDCVSDPCHLAWLIRDNRQLLAAVKNAACSNGTAFEQLNSQTICPRLTTLANDTTITTLKLCPLSDLIYPCTCLDTIMSPLTLNNGLIINCKDEMMGDPVISQILNLLLQTAVDDRGDNLIGQLILSNNSLSKVPDEICLFHNLSLVDLRFNNIRSVASGSFKFPRQVRIPGKVDLGFNRIKNVEKGAFQGQYLTIALDHNRLTRFDSSVFKSVLQSMSRDNRSQGINIEHNPVDCDIDDPCELAWIFRDNLRLDVLVDIGKCPEGTLFYEFDRKICPAAANNSSSMTLLEQLEEEELWMRRKLSIVIPSVIASSVFVIILLVAGAAILYKYLQEKKKNKNSPALVVSTHNPSSSLTIAETGFINRMAKNVAAKVEATKSIVNGSPADNNYEML